MSKLQLLRVLLNDRLTAAAVEIFGAVEKTVLEYQEEIERLQNRLQVTTKIQMKETLEHVPAEQPNYEQAWSPRLDLENPELTQIKEEQQDLWTNQEAEQFQGPEADVVDFKVAPSFAESDLEHENPFGSMTFAQTQNVVDRESESKPVDVRHFDTVAQINGSDISGNPPPDSQSNGTSQSSALSVGLDGLYSTLWPSNPPMREHYSPPSTSLKTHCCRDCGESFALTSDLQRHVTLARFRTGF
ncbi:hypothetical protein DPEC_G00180710 [Dallia pectoralis]|uniref:Uncharacterized protein n=1 Tax=Dallia pectoralis TaxID=75939 RepID=A0ACC2G9Z5_DALPE|nr:hypothetical protein DPEC_G00180710 [Dallia pectoralis]